VCEIATYPALSKEIRNHGWIWAGVSGEFLWVFETALIGELKFVGMFVTQLWRGPDYRARAA
jgi:hypothetical protein